MKKMIFNSFLKTPGKITFNALLYENDNLIKQDELFFELSEKIMVNDNLIAIAICTFCRNLYDEIYFDLTLNEKTIENIIGYTKARVTSKMIINEKFFNETNNNISLNFSGGFDSLAAKILLGDNIELVAINFTGFKREYDFFKKFNPYTVTTNFRELGYSNERNDWTYLGVGSILFSDFLNLRSQSFGTNLESSAYHGLAVHSLKDIYENQPFNFANLNIIKVIQGLTEIGTALILCNTQPNLINDSLISLSHPGTEKRYRKQLIIQVLINKFNFKNIYLEYTDPQSENQIRSWGNNFSLDCLALYLLKYGGIDETSKIVKNIPNEVLTFVENNSFEYMEKFNTNYLNNIPNNFKSEFIKNLADSKILPYNENDFEELKKVYEFMSKFYPNIKNL